MIASLRALESAQWAPAAAPQIEAFLRQQADAGRTPEGEPWPKRQAGGKALRGAAGALEVRVSGEAVIARISGRYAFHHFGAQGKPERRQLPLGRMPKELGNAIRLGLVDVFRAKTKAGKRGYAYYARRGIDPRSVK